VIDDVYAICQTLKITKFSILAHSAGAIYALATALRMPQHIRGRIHLLAPWIPPSQMNVSGAKQPSPPGNSLPTSQRILRALPTPILKAANSSFMSATSSSITSSLPKSPRRNKRKSNTGRETPALSGRSTVTPGPGDKENQGPNASLSKPPNPNGALAGAMRNSQDPNSEAAILAAAANTLMEKERQVTYDTRLTHAIWDLATSGANPAVDLLVCLERRHTIGFRYVDITRAVVIHHGSKDTRVPVENVKWLGKMMRRCEVRILEGEGHGLMASAGVMGNVLMDIAREWEDWMRVVQQKPSDNRSRTLRERASVGAFR
jgi:pimeloyl-ACP methyl ester carboxylesterase